MMHDYFPQSRCTRSRTRFCFTPPQPGIGMTAIAGLRNGFAYLSHYPSSVDKVCKSTYMYIMLVLVHGSRLDDCCRSVSGLPTFKMTFPLWMEGGTGIKDIYTCTRCTQYKSWITAFKLLCLGLGCLNKDRAMTTKPMTDAPEFLVFSFISCQEISSTRRQHESGTLQTLQYPFPTELSP
ncbi:uncharacterized protein BO97DRAFT_117338 [Aspergillus homomorphus CBS 101889]|uniref:Uncharacterized protein n=1 Tax=Aspergillus homomorphus (strain CBS 101889) TaxID=1450537 RepID=A0A395HTI0_ASPHC|nr:hypothetical protein BO97DRAFT_117338 [Aspergillus homomorphus CBS 101889]RAL10685.1 hypothetical protein BO97DRAFT_117338 [Aspergillus homomorphus CBS 101889]